jgi:hypothetical protein
MNRKQIVVSVLALGLLVAGSVAAFSPGAIVEAVRSGVTSVGPSFPRHERVTCDTTAGGVEIRPSGGNLQLVSYECKAGGTVFVGSTTGAADALTAANGVQFDSGERFGANVQRAERCITSAGSVVLSCRFLVTQW